MESASFDPGELSRKLRRFVLDVDPERVLKDLRSAGLDVTNIHHIRTCAAKYWRIEQVAEKYADRAVYWCSLGGFTAGVGGVVTAVTLSVGDLAHMAARLYWLCQRLAILNGFDPQDDLQRDRLEQLYLLALGFDTATQAVIKQQLGRAVGIAGKRGAYSNYILKLIMLVAEKFGVQLSSKAAAEFIPVVGAVAGAAINYAFASGIAKVMRTSFKNEFFNRWQVQNG